jgi:tetratricopeptide (TPR) repeat protein
MAQLNNAPNWMDLYNKAQYQEASQVLREDFKTQEPQDPNKLLVGNNIGSMYFKKKKYAEARDILVPTLEIMQRQHHPHIITCELNLAWTYAMLNDLDSAERLVQHIETENDVLDTDKILNHITQQRQRSQTSYSVLQECNTTAGDLCKMAVPPTKMTDSTKSLAYDKEESTQNTMEHRDYLNPFDVWSAYKSGLYVDEDAIRHARVWVTIFKSAGWLDTAVSAGAYPVLIGNSIGKFLNGDTKSSIYLVLLDWAPLVNRRDIGSIFDFLQEHDYNPVRKEVHIRGTNIIINIQSLMDNYSYTIVKDITQVMSSGYRDKRFILRYDMQSVQSCSSKASEFLLLLYVFSTQGCAIEETMS